MNVNCAGKMCRIRHLIPNPENFEAFNRWLEHFKIVLDQNKRELWEKY